ncbi:MAG: pirin family protein [Bacteroidales bacterium]
MTIRKVEAVIAPREPHWVGDGFRVHNFIPANTLLSMERMSPFILLDYNSKYSFPPSPRPFGVGVHPHRGFETVTIAYKGSVQHHDSSGGGGIIGEGDVQWMTAADGILHKEYHEKEWSLKGGVFQMVQLWVNLPAKEKRSKPKYQAITNNAMGRVVLENNMGEIEVIAGEYKTAKGPATTFTPIALMNGKLKKGGSATFNWPQNWNTALLVIEGTVLINGTDTAPQDHFVLFKNDGESFTIRATEESIVLLMSGEPIEEPIASYGPFVMNTQKELVEAFDDFNNGKFGYLED